MDKARVWLFVGEAVRVWLVAGAFVLVVWAIRSVREIRRQGRE